VQLEREGVQPPNEAITDTERHQHHRDQERNPDVLENP